jgi:hypothetical protein
MHFSHRYSTSALLIVSIAVFLLSPPFIIDSKKGAVGTINPNTNVLVPPEAPFPIIDTGIALKNRGEFYSDDRLVSHILQVVAAEKPGKAIFHEDPEAAEPTSVSNPFCAQLSVRKPYSGAPSKDTLFFSSSGLSPPIA